MTCVTGNAATLWRWVADCDGDLGITCDHADE